MGKRTEYTPRSRIRQALRMLWMKSRERASAIKRDKYTCVHCHKKQSKAKGKEFAVMVHHKNQICDWENMINIIYKELLCNPLYLETICKECHDKIHKKEEKK